MVRQAHHERWEFPIPFQAHHERLPAFVVNRFGNAGHINRALDNGVTKDEIGEIITHVAFYAGVPTAANVAGIAKAVYDERG